MTEQGKPLVWLKAEVKTPPFSHSARIAAGYLLRKLQEGESLEMPDCRKMPIVGVNCYELRIPDTETGKTWRIVYRVDDDAIIIATVFAKKQQKTPKAEIELSKTRLKRYDELTR